MPRQQVRFLAHLLLVSPVSWKPGAFNKRTLGKVLKNHLRSFSDKKGSKCSLTKPKDCTPPSATSAGRQQGQPEAFPCTPECRQGKANLVPRGCLPWETGTEMCLGKKPARKLESATCEHLCEPYVGQGIIDKFKVSACEYRRFQKCLEKEKDPHKCLGLGPELGVSKKTYPMMHAVQKESIIGSPITSHHFVMPKKEEDC